jgi:uncharacterized protein YbbC (DUF1343 family)
MKKYLLGLLLILFIFQAKITKAQIKVGAESMNDYLPFLAKRNVALVVNQTSFIGNIHLADTLEKLKIKVVRIFTPEHGLSGSSEAGEKVNNSFYGKTKIPVISLYGDKKKPSKNDLANIEGVVFDIQDVGVRFYTYISTLAYMMETCAENHIPLIVLDRPNPNGFYVDGPVLEKGYTSFVGLHSVPVVYGMTIGEYALMVNGEGWLANGVKCDLKVIKIQNYSHKSRYLLPIAPSPNLKTKESIYLYPSLCFFEGTNISVGRGTDHPFEVIGTPGFSQGNYSFVPHAITGVCENPLYKDIECRGFYLNEFCNSYIAYSGKLYLFWLKGFYDNATNKDSFFNSFFDKLAGTDKLRKQIIAGETPENIRKSWTDDITKFMEVRKKYLLYKDFDSK